MASFAIHLALGLLIINSRSAVTYLGPDALSYDAVARAIVNHWSHGDRMPLLALGKEGYYFLVASLYWIFRPATWAAVALNAALAAALIPIVSDTTNRLFGRAAARYVPAVLLLVPGMLLWPSQLLKEAPFFFLLAVAANCAVRLVNKYSPLPLLVLVAVLPSMLWFRAQLSLAVIAGVLAGIVFGHRDLVVGVVGGLVAVALIGGRRVSWCRFIWV